MVQYLLLLLLINIPLVYGMISSSLPTSLIHKPTDDSPVISSHTSTEYSDSDTTYDDDFKDDSETEDDDHFTRAKHENMSRKISFMQAYMNGSFILNNSYISYPHYEDSLQTYSFPKEEISKALQECKKAAERKWTLFGYKKVANHTRHHTYSLEQSRDLAAQYFVRLNIKGKLLLQYERFYYFTHTHDVPVAGTEKRIIADLRNAFEKEMKNPQENSLTNLIKMLKEQRGLNLISLTEYIAAKADEIRQEKEEKSE